MHISPVTGAQCFLRNYELRYALWEGKVCYFVHTICVLCQIYSIRILVHFYKTTSNVICYPSLCLTGFLFPSLLVTKNKISHCLSACYFSCSYHPINFIVPIIYTKSFYFVPLLFFHIFSSALCSQASLISLLFFCPTTRRVACNLTYTDASNEGKFFIIQAWYVRSESYAV